MLRSDFGNPIVITFIKLKSVLYLPQISSENRVGLRTFHQQLKSVIMCLNSMVDTSAINSIKNTTNGITRLPRYLRSKFYQTCEIEQPIFKFNKRNDERFNNRGYSSFFLMGIFLKHL